MAVTVVVVSGPIGAGKTTLAQGLARRFGARHLPSEGFLRKQGGSGSRRSSQELTLTLDRETGGRWLAEGVLTALHGQDLEASHRVSRAPRLLIVDAASSEAQLDGLRASPGLRVVHVHLEVPEPEQALRFAQQRSRARHEDTTRAPVDKPSCAAPQDDGQDRFEAAWAHPSERAVHALASLAELVVDTARVPPEAVLVRVASRLGLYGRTGERLVDLILPGPNGDVDTRPLTAQLAPHYDVLLRMGEPDPVPLREELEDAFARGHRVLIESAGMVASVCLAATGIAPGRLRRIVMVCRSEGPTFDWVGLREVASLNGPTDLALVLSGDLAATNWAARRFDQLTDAARHHLEELERVAGAPVSFLAPSARARHLIERRPW
ncbi:AAA family ATPase [Corallococcus exercitus]|uniref:AAA family ATPase n=1 Tax=Corallococcus exercitus TaxID=2316736 RepID=UPI0035D4ECDC